MKLDNKKYEMFNELGYVILPKFMSDGDCKEILSNIQFKEEQQLEYPYSSVNTLRVCDTNYDTSTITKFLREFFGVEYECWYGKVYPRVSYGSVAEPYHQDYWYRQYDGVDCSAYKQAFLCLSDLKYNPLNVFEGSHKMGLLKHEQIMERNGMSKYKVKSSLLDNIGGFKSLSLNLGDVVIFNYFLIHGSSSNSSPVNQPRAVFQYRDSSLKYNSIQEVFNIRREWEISVLEKMLDNRKQQNKIPIGYPSGGMI